MVAIASFHPQKHRCIHGEGRSFPRSLQTGQPILPIGLRARFRRPAYRRRHDCHTPWSGQWFRPSDIYQSVVPAPVSDRGWASWGLPVVDKILYGLRLGKLLQAGSKNGNACGSNHIRGRCGIRVPMIPRPSGRIRSRGIHNSLPYRAALFFVRLRRTTFLQSWIRACRILLFLFLFRVVLLWWRSGGRVQERIHPKSGSHLPLAVLLHRCLCLSLLWLSDWWQVLHVSVRHWSFVRRSSFQQFLLMKRSNWSGLKLFSLSDWGILVYLQSRFWAYFVVRCVLRYRSSYLVSGRWYCVSLDLRWSLWCGCLPGYLFGILCLELQQRSDRRRVVHRGCSASQSFSVRSILSFRYEDVPKRVQFVGLSSWQVLVLFSDTRLLLHNACQESGRRVVLPVHLFDIFPCRDWSNRSCHTGCLSSGYVLLRRLPLIFRAYCLAG